MSRIEKESERKKGELIQDELTDDALTGKFRVYQRRRGHRFSLDDLLVAAIALETRPDAKRILDLGSGIGSVPLMVAAINQGAAIVCVEAQEVSYRLLVRNIERNDLGDRLGTILGDFRHV
ncbi:MAG: methyltransferase, partial [Sandaracinaceae bacterium]|nr:methyltransferase [Sandaracinaceae bacterium]